MVERRPHGVRIQRQLVAQIFFGRYVLRRLFKDRGIYYIRVRDVETDAVRRLSTRERSLKKAKQVAVELIEEIHRQDQFAISPVAFEEAFREFLALKNVSEKTRRDHGYTLGIMLEDFQAFAVHEVGPKEVEEFMQKVAAKGRSPRTQKLYLSLLRGFYKWSIRRRYATADPTDGLRTPREHKRIGYALTIEEAGKLLEACQEPILRTINYTNRKAAEQTLQPPEYLFLAVLIGLYTGLRRGNIEDLRWSDLNLRKRQLRIEAKRMKAREDLVIPIHWKLTEVLRRVLRERGEVEPNARVLGVEVREIRKSFKAALRRADLPESIRLHDLRHSYSSWLETRCSYLVLKRLMGHAPPKDATAIYVHTRWEDLVEAIDRLPDLLAPPDAEVGSDDEASALR